MAKPIQSQYSSSNLVYPYVDMNKLTPDQQEEIQFYMSQIQRLDRDYKQTKTQSIKSVSQQYEKERKGIESEEFFK